MSTWRHMGNYASRTHNDGASSTAAGAATGPSSHAAAPGSSTSDTRPSAEKLSPSAAPNKPTFIPPPARLNLLHFDADDVVANKAALVSTLMKELNCSQECAESSVEMHYPDTARCRELIQAKLSSTFVVVVGLVTQQREYEAKLCADIRLAFAQFPLLNELPSGVEYAAAADSDATPSSSALPPIDWAAVRQELFTPNKPLLYYFYTELANVGIPNNLALLENAYHTLVASKGCSNVLGCYASGDGTMGAVDYVNERLCGRSADEIARQMHLSPEAMTELEKNNNSSSSSGGGGNAEPTPKRAYVNTFGNNPATSHSKRQDKGSSQEALREAGLAYIRSVVTTSAAEALERIHDGSLLLPVVVKPSTGAGSEFVTLCYTDDDVVVAFAMVEGMRTSQGTDAAVLVVEEYIEGPEYVVNTVSYNGVAVVTDVWQSWKFPKAVYTTGMSQAAEINLRPTSLNERKKHKTSILYDKQTLIPNLAELPPEHEARRVTDYTLKCLDALELRNGCAHCELRVDMRATAAERRRKEKAEGQRSSDDEGEADNTSAVVGEPVLIELNPRMQGDAPRSTDVVGYDQFSLLVYIGEAANTFGGATAASAQRPFRGPSFTSARGDIPWPPVPRLYHGVHPAHPLSTTVLFLVSPADGVLNGAAVSVIRSLPSFERFTRNVIKANEPGYVSQVRNTVDLFSSPAACVLRAATAAQVDADVTAIRAMEASSLSALVRSLLQEAGAQVLHARQLRRSVEVVADRIRVLRQEKEKADAAPPAAEPSGGTEAETAATSSDSEGDSHYRRGGGADDAASLQAEIDKEEARLSALKATVEETAEDGKRVRQTFRDEFTKQSPPPLYIPFDVFNLMKNAEVASILSVT